MKFRVFWEVEAGTIKFKEDITSIAYKNVSV